MSTAIKGLRRVQIGVETTRGTPVAATRRMFLTEGELRIIQEAEEYNDEIQGTLARAASKPTIWREHTEADLTMPLDFDQILLALEAGMKGGITPTQPGGAGPAELWTYTPSVTADPAPKAFTLEWATHDGTNEESDESSYGIVTGFEITAGDDGLSQLVINVEARKAKASASTAALAVPTTLERVPVGLWTLFNDTTWGGLGGTQITEQISNIKITWGDFIRPERYHDGRADLDFSKYEYSAGRLLDVTFDVISDPNSGFLPDERVKKSAGDLVFVRLEALGSAFAAPDGAFTRQIRFDGCFVHASDSLQARGADRDGLEMTSCHLISTYDPTQAQDVEVTVQTLLSAFP